MTDRLRRTDAPLAEFERLIAAFQTTSVSLERSYLQLQDQVQKLQAELEEERDQRIQLERLAAMGEISMELAHEIRNPLGSIELFASMIDGPFAEQIVRSVRLLNHSVTNILEFGQPVDPRFEEILFDELIQGVVTFLGPLAAQKGVEISATVEAGLAGFGDYELLHRMLLNLVLNALREVPEGGTIRLVGEAAGGRIRLLVDDNGPGIPADTLSRIFDPMFSTSRNGCGLGLPIVKRIVESHGGSVEVRSSAAGTAFEISLAGTDWNTRQSGVSTLEFRSSRGGSLISNFEGGKSEIGKSPFEIRNSQSEIGDSMHQEVYQ